MVSLTRKHCIDRSQIWAKELKAEPEAPARAVALYNSDDIGHTIHLDLWTVFGSAAPVLTETTVVMLRDLWARAPLPPCGAKGCLISEHVNVTVPASGVALLKATVEAV